MSNQIENLQTPGTYKILTGELPKPVNPERQTIEGNFKAPSEFWKKRVNSFTNETENIEILYDYQRDQAVALNTYPEVNYNNIAARVEFDFTNTKITLIVDEATPRQITVIGTLKLNPMLDKLKINKPDDTYADFNELYRAIKFNRAVFKDSARHDQLLKDLKTFKQRVSISVEESDDLKGNIKNNLSIESAEGPELDFELHMPVFVGEEKKDIRVTAEVVFRNGKPQYHLTSLELSETIYQETEKAFETEKANFSDIAIICK